MKIYKPKKQYMLLVILLLLFINIYVAARLSVLKENADLIALCYPPGIIQASVWEQFAADKEEDTKEDKEEMKEENAVFSRIALWKSLGENTILAGQTGRERKVSGYQIKGQPDAVFGTDLTCGRYFLDQEDNVCLLDTGTARQLFGSDNVLGMEIQMDEKSCRIIGVLRGKQPICVIPANDAHSSGSSIGYDGVAVRKRNLEQSSGVEFSRIEAMFGSTGGQQIDGKVYYVTACLLYFGVFSMILILAGIALGKQLQTKWISLESLTVAAGVLFFGIRYVSPGSDYLPTYWSDFGFFSRIFQEKAEQIQSLATHQEFSTWQNIFRTWQQLMTVGIFAGLFFIIVYLFAIKFRFSFKGEETHEK